MARLIVERAPSRPPTFARRASHRGHAKCSRAQKLRRRKLKRNFAWRADARRGPVGFSLSLGDFDIVLMTSVPDAGACDVHRVETLSVANFCPFGSFDVTQMPSRGMPSVVRDSVRDVPRFSVLLSPLLLTLHTDGGRLITRVRCPSAAG